MKRSILPDDGAVSGQIRSRYASIIFEKRCYRLELACCYVDPSIDKELVSTDTSEQSLT